MTENYANISDKFVENLTAFLLIPPIAITYFDKKKYVTIFDFEDKMNIYQNSIDSFVMSKERDYEGFRKFIDENCYFFEEDYYGFKLLIRNDKLVDKIFERVINLRLETLFNS